MKYLSIIVFTLQISLVFGQSNNIILGNFDNFIGDCQLGQGADPHPFLTPPCNTQGWYASQGSPHLERNGYGNSTTFIQMYDASPDHPCCPGEGVFRVHSFETGKKYLLSFRINLPSQAPNYMLTHFFVRLTNNLDVPPPFVGSPGPPYPNLTPPDYQIILDIPDLYPFDNWVEVHVSFIPDKDYDQIWFIGENLWSLFLVDGFILLDDVTLIEDYNPQIADGCCPENVSYSNTSSLPGLTEANNNIEAGENVTVKSGQNVTFSAGNSINLKPGFTAESGSTFSAVIDGCSSPLTLELSLERSFCNVTIVPDICGGTGFYNYRWNTDEITPTITFAPTASSTYSLTVTDAGTGNSVTRSISVGPNPELRGNFSVFIPNVFTPNGDNVNDTWEIQDANAGTGPIKAFEYDLLIVDRNGSPRYEDNGSNPNGYNGGDIFWDGKDNGGSWVPNDTYFYALTLKNCDNPGGQLYNGWVDVLGSPAHLNSRLANVITNENHQTELLRADSFKFWPNPTRNSISVEYTISEQSRFNLKLINLEGKVVRTLEDNKNKIPGRYSSQYFLDNIQSGIYFIKHESPNYSKMEKLIVK